MTTKYTPEVLAAIHEGQSLALKMHNDVVVPADASVEVRMFAISALTAELAVTSCKTMDEAIKVIDTIAATATSSLQSGFDYKAQSHKTQ